MKKLIQFSVVAAIVALGVACGPSAEDQAKKQADSAKAADSIAKAKAEDSIAKAKADTTKKMGADSAKPAADAKKK